MLSFKLEPSTHEKFSRFSKALFFLVFLGGAGWLIFSAFSGYREATAILADHGVVTVPLALDEVTEERGRKGRTKLMFNFVYQFEAKGQQYQGGFSAAESNAGPYLADDVTVDVAYSNADPSRFDRLERLQDQAEVGSLLKRLVIAVLGAAFVALVLHLLATGVLFVRRPEPESVPAG